MGKEEEFLAGSPTVRAGYVSAENIKKAARLSAKASKNFRNGRFELIAGVTLMTVGAVGGVLEASTGIGLLAILGCVVGYSGETLLNKAKKQEKKSKKLLTIPKTNSIAPPPQPS